MYTVRVRTRARVCMGGGLGLNQIEFTLDIREKGDESLDTLSISNIWQDERSRTVRVIFIYNDFMHNEQYRIVPNRIIYNQEEILINRLTMGATANFSNSRSTADRVPSGF